MNPYQLSERQTWILKVLAEEGVASTNRLYIRTSPACLATGRRRAMGTYGWKTPDQLQRLGLIECHVTSRGTSPRRQVRYTWSLTPAGHVVVNLLGPIHVMGFFRGDGYALAFG